MPWSRWWSCPCHPQESPHPARLYGNRDQRPRVWATSTSLDIGPGRTRSAGNQGQAQHGSSSEAQQPVEGCGRGRRLCRSVHEASSWVSSAVPLGSAAPSKSWNHVLTQDGWRSPDTALCFQMRRATKSRPASVLPWATKTLCRLRRPKPATSDGCQFKVCIAAA